MIVIFCFNCLHCLSSNKNQTLTHEKYVKKSFCGVVMPFEVSKIIELIHYRKSDQTPSTVYTYLESLIKKLDEYKNNPEKFSTTKVGEHIPYGYSMSTI